MSSERGTDPNYYEVLGVLRNATAAEISAAYHLLARQHHPDMSRDSKRGTAKIKLVNQAYEVLSDSKKRRD